MRVRWLAVPLLMGVLVLSSSATADARYLTKREAKRETKHHVRERAKERRYRWVTSWAVEPARKCSRHSSVVVWCDFRFIDETNVVADGSVFGCYGEIRIREGRKRYHHQWGQEGCGWEFWEY